MLKYYWGKTNSDSWHPLLCHSLDSAAVADVWSSSPALARALVPRGVCKEEALKWVLFFVYMHDFGKIDTRFQSLNFEVWKKLQPDISENDYENKNDYSYLHGYGGLVHFKNDIGITSDIDILDELNFEEDALNWIKQAINHHDRNTNAETKRIIVPTKNGVLTKRDNEARKGFLEIGKRIFLDGMEIIRGIFLPSYAPTPVFEGFCSVCDWIASCSEFFPYEKYPDSPLDYYISRLKYAKDALHQCGLIAERLKTGGMKSLFPDIEPRGVQQIELPKSDSGSLIMIEAPTGSGKTEAALSIASEQVAAGMADSIIFALPTQATANAMFDRIQKVACKLFPNSGVNVVLAHGKDKFNEGLKILRERGESFDGRNLVEEDGIIICSKWIGSSKKRSMLGQICICTLDQVLLSALRGVKHNFVRTLSIGRSILIIDEIHSYSCYMNTLTERVLKDQHDANGSVILLSATLPERRRKEIYSKWCGEEILSSWNPDNAYPLVSYSTVEDKKVNEFRLPEIIDKTDATAGRCVSLKSLRLKDSFPDENLYMEIINYAKSGEVIAFICNMVKDAQEIADELQKRTNIPVDLFHARFTFSDRDKIERSIIKRYGKERVHGEGRILVATQVVEQSLDLDFDRMYTQLCPIDLLFQRIGRLQRHQRPRISKGLPSCIVISPIDDNFGMHGVIYSCDAFLWRTRYLIENNSCEYIRFPEVYRKWTDMVYSKVFQNEPEEMVKSYSKRELDEATAKMLANYISGAVFLKDESAAFLTRDGETSIPLLLYDESNNTLLDEASTPLPWQKGGLGDEVSSLEAVQMQLINCPESWERKYFSYLQKIDGIYIAPVQYESTKWSIRLNSTKLSYTNQKGLWLDKE